jgi:hypothetical protein
MVSGDLGMIPLGSQEDLMRSERKINSILDFLITMYCCQPWSFKESKKDKKN